MTEIRWATREDVQQFYGNDHPCSIQAIAVIEDGECIGLGGIYYNGGNCCAFSETKREIGKRTILKALRMFKDMLNRKPCRVLAAPHCELPTAPDFLKHCGFIPFNTGVYEYVRD